MGLMDGKVVVIFGVANYRSIGWSIAQALVREGATAAFCAQERVVPEVRKLAALLSSDEVYECDVQNEDDVPAVFRVLRERHGGIDAVVHSLAFANREDISSRRFVETPRAGFQLALDVSAYSLTYIAREAEPLLEARGGGAIITLSYLGSERVIPNYNVMGVAKAALECSVRYLAYDLGPKNVRVNAISAGPQRTLSARAISGFQDIERIVTEHSPLRRNIDGGDLGNAALYLLSDLGRNVTGQVMHVDAGYSIMGL
ncbi:MAG: enoyl-ACP reductase [Chloroflexi bacterium]|nr:enoyl-ACP reductase [Chloroflexota bacterium]